PANITKLSKGRTTFFSKEASKLLRPILKELKDEDLVFGTNEKVHLSETNSEQILARILEKIGLNDRYESNNRYKINTHSFRAFGITKLSRHDPNFAKKLAGQKGYLLQYDRMEDEEKLELYEKYENDLIIDDTEKQKAEIKKLEKEKTELEASNKRIEELEKKVDEFDTSAKMLHGLVREGIVTVEKSGGYTSLRWVGAKKKPKK
ncbi:MAG: hypothetical protein IIC67_06640, partial [Thaumarchaeota archaeon]|nr:hypothetical protein [Nitrososphaerota archaeon]